MSEQRNSERQDESIIRRYSEVNEELKRLQGMTNQEAVDRSGELFEELITLDMALAPMRRAMGRQETPKANSPSGSHE
jgi:hypothetical protein